MSRIVRWINLIYAIILIAVLATVNVQFKDADRMIYGEVEKNSSISVNLMHYQIERWLMENKGVLLNLKAFVEKNSNLENAILNELVAELSSSDVFTSLYYGTIDNKMINASGFIPPEGFDLRTRPWYERAVEEDGFIITNPFLNASKDAWIVTMAIPVKAQNGSIMGVLGGDITLENLEGILKSAKYLGDSSTYIISSKHEEIMTLNYIEDNAPRLDEMLVWYSESGEKGEKFDSLNKTYNLVEGIFHYHRFEDTGWIVLTYTPFSAYSSAIERLEKITLLLSLAIVLVFGALVLVLKRFITQPLIEFENQIEKIDIEGSEDQRIILSSDKALGNLSMKINLLLSKIFHQIREINDDRDELRALNEELEATYGQLIATEQEVSRQKQNFEALFRNSQDAVVMFDQGNKILDINRAFTELFGYELEEIMGINVDEIVATEDIRAEAEAITKTVFGGENENLPKFEAVRYTKDRKPVHVSIQGIPMNSQNHVIGGYGIYSDISERKQREASLAYMTTHDDLTGLYNRAYFENCLESYKLEANLPIGIIMIDVNGLKLINDAFGHREGDKLLVSVAHKLKEVCTDREIIARMGGDEFSILIKNTDESHLEEISSLILDKCNKIKVNEVSISVCVGYSQLKNVADSYAQVFKEAEDYLNKRKLSEGPSVRGKAIYTIINTLHEKNKREEQHSKRVSKLSYGLGKALNLTDREVNELKTIGLLHDVGKIAIDENILNKNGKLTAEEYAEMQKHPAIGYRILSAVNEMGEIADYVLAHHESYDGTGYPKGLKGNEIPYLSRIITVIDAFDAMTSDRTYRSAMTYEAAYAELRRVSGVQFDPEIVETFISYMESTSETEEI